MSDPTPVATSPKRAVFESLDERWSQFDVVIFVVLTAMSARLLFALLDGIHYLVSPTSSVAYNGSQEVTSEAIAMFTQYGTYVGLFYALICAGVVGWRVRIAATRAHGVSARRDEREIVTFVWHLLRVSRYCRWLLVIFALGSICSVGGVVSEFVDPAKPQALFDVASGGFALVVTAMWACGIWATFHMNEYCNGLFTLFDDAGELEIPADATGVPIDPAQAW